MSATSTTKSSGRLLSLDALRGFDMFWIMGAEAIFHELYKLTDSPFWGALSTQMEHVEWNGFRFYDLIFPLFLFISGVAMPFSLARRIDKGVSKQELAKHVVRRGLTLVLFGIIYNGALRSMDWDQIRYASVLGRIGLAYMFAGLIFIYASRRNQLFWFVGILISYWAMMMFIPVPGYGAGDLSLEGSLVGYVDRMLLPGVLWLKVHDPEGILSTFPAIATALMGALAGYQLRDVGLAPSRKALVIGIAGIVSLGLGWLWDLNFPVNKNLWTSSFVLVAGGWSLILLSIFYYIIDVRGWKSWAFFFIVIGLNSITIYMAPVFIDFFYTTGALFEGLFSYFSETWRPLLGVIAFVGIKWLFLYFLYRKKWFLRI